MLGVIFMKNQAQLVEAGWHWMSYSELSGVHCICHALLEEFKAAYALKVSYFKVLTAVSPHASDIFRYA